MALRRCAALLFQGCAINFSAQFIAPSPYRNLCTPPGTTMTRSKMPFDLSQASGKWRNGGHSSNYPQIMEKLGIPIERMEKMREGEYSVKTSLSGNEISAKMEFMGKVIVDNIFTLGVESQEAGVSGKKRRVMYTMEEDKLVSVYPDHDGKGLFVRFNRDIEDNNTIHVDIECGALQGWVRYTRC